MFLAKITLKSKKIQILGVAFSTATIFSSLEKGLFAFLHTQLRATGKCNLTSLFLFTGQDSITLPRTMQHNWPQVPGAKEKGRAKYSNQSFFSCSDCIYRTKFFLRHRIIVILISNKENYRTIRYRNKNSNCHTIAYWTERNCLTRLIQATSGA